MSKTHLLIERVNDVNFFPYFTRKLFIIYLKHIPMSDNLNFQGFLVASDGYMNLQLASTEEYIDGSLTGNLGEVLVR